MADRPAVTVITTAYNAAPFIRAAVDSVLAQRDVTVQHVVVDDGSDDDTLGVLRARPDPRLHVIAAGRIGRGRALNLALGKARTDFVAVQDADDVSHPDRLRTEVAVLRAHPGTSAVGSGQVMFSGTNVPPWWEVGDNPPVAVVNSHLPFYNPLSHSSVLFRRTPLATAGGYDEERQALFDWDLYVRLAATGATLLKVNTPLVAKRIHNEQYFEAGRRVQYALACVHLQWRAVRALNRSRTIALTLPWLFLYRLAPRWLRLGARRLSACRVGRA